MKIMTESLKVIGIVGATFLGCAVIVGLCLFGLVLWQSFQFQDYPDPLPPGHHRTSAEYYWKVVIDKVDENRVFFTDFQPRFTIGLTDDNQQAQTVVCMDSPRQPKKCAPDVFYTNELCDGGEGKIQIIPQGAIVKY